MIRQKTAEFVDELNYAFGGCMITSSSGKYRSAFGLTLPDKINILFSDTPFDWEKDRNDLFGVSSLMFCC